MKRVKEYLVSVRFSLSYAFRFVPKETALVGFFVIVGGILPYGSAYLLGQLVNLIVAGAKSGSYSGIWYLLAGYSIVGALPYILSNVRSYISRRRYLILSMETELDVLKRREEIDIARYEDPKFQDLIQRTFRNGTGPIYQLGDGQFDTAQALTSLIVGTVLAIHFNIFIYLVIIISATPSFFTDIKYASKMWGIWSKDSPEQRRVLDLRQHINYKIFLIETKLLQAGNKILSWMRKILSNFTDIQLNVEKKRLLHTSLADALNFLGFSFGLFLIVREVIAGQIQVGSLVYMMGTLSNVRNSIGSFLTNISRQYENHLIVQDIVEFMNTKSVIVEPKDPKILKLTSAPEIVFENVSFKYPHSENWSLRNFSATFKAGYKIGLVGNNGAGKTTLVKLLCRIYDPTEGKILINGIDLRDISTKEWWSFLGVMFQDYASYDFSVKEAIAIGRPDSALKLDQVKTAAEISQAHTFIEEWKDTYNEQLGVEFGGKEPSKGQRQKLSIAKILYRNAPVMILDEPTASVDAESEAKIFDSLEKLSESTTALLISHDFSTILQCNHIFVLENGKLIEEGSHKELTKLKGKYAELFNLQAERFKKRG
ncbi:MAG: ABC transporter ATP-binding protein [bacterium]